MIIALAQTNPRVGDFARNLKGALDVVEAAKKRAERESSYFPN